MKKYIKKILVWSNLFFAGCLFISFMASFVSPAKIWLFAFFGLGFPLLLLINIGFFVFWLFRRNLFFMVSLVVIILCWENINRFKQLKFFYKAPSISHSIKLMSFNVRGFNQYNWLQGFSVRDSILNYIDSEAPALVCFQDYYTYEGNALQSRNYIKSKLPSLPYIHLNFTSHGKPKANFGVATYSKYPIINKGCINFNNSVNSCIYSDIVINNDTLRLYNVHFESIGLRKSNNAFTDSLLIKLFHREFDEVKEISDRLRSAFIKRAEQVNEVSWHISHSPYKVIVCGDFNDTPVSYSYQKVRGNLMDAFLVSGEGMGNTYLGNFPSFRIDYIFHDRKIKSFNYQTKKVNLSDHYPVSCNLIF